MLIDRLARLIIPGDRAYNFRITDVVHNHYCEPEIRGFIAHGDLYPEENTSRVTSGIKDVIFNDPATIVIWNDGSKTIV